MAAESAFTSNEDQPRSNALRGILLAALFIGLLIVFTLVKVPQPKIHAWLLGTINQQMNPMGIQVAAEEGHIVLGPGIKYEMSDVRLVKTLSQKSLKFSHLEVAPSLLPLLQGKIGGTFRLENEGSGSISGQALTQGEDFETTLTLESLDLGRTGILPFSAGVEGTANINGVVELSGNASQMTGLSGKVDLTITKLVIDSQKVMGFDIPRTAAADGVVSLLVGSGKVSITSFRVGKPGGNDDLNAVVSGDIKLNRAIENSDANLKVRFGFSDRYRQEKTISLLDSLLGQYKHSDGIFAMKFSGPLSSSQPLPDP